MSTKKSISNAYIFLFTIVATSVFLPFVDLSPFLLSGLIAIFFATIILFINPFVGLLLFCIIRPVLDYFTNEKIFDIGPISVNIAALFGTITVMAATILLISNRKKILLVPMIGQWSLFLFFVTLSVVFSIDKIESISELIRLLTIFSMFLIGYFTIQTTSRLNTFVNVLISSIIIPIITASWQYLNQLGLSLSFEDVPNRIFGTFAHPNLFAFYLSFVLGLLLFKVLRNKKKGSKLFWILLMTILLLLLIQTYTRGAWIVFALMIVILGTIRFRIMLVLSTSIIIASYLLFTPIQDRLDSSFSTNQSNSVQWRFRMWNDSIVYALEKPLTGYGAGTTENVVETKREQKLESHAVHNDFIKITLEYGFGGLVTFIVLLTTLLTKTTNILKIINKKSTSWMFVLVFIAIISSFIVASFFDNIIDTTALQWALWSLAGAIFGTFYKK